MGVRWCNGFIRQRIRVERNVRIRFSSRKELWLSRSFYGWNYPPSFCVYFSAVQIHIFGEGNTRTTAVFFIKYLRSLGFSATNDIFAENSWYFRNALVRANYTDLQKGIHETTEYIEIFLRNLLLDEKHPLQNRTLLLSNLVQAGIIEPVSGHGKGKYRFVKR